MSTYQYLLYIIESKLMSQLMVWYQYVNQYLKNKKNDN